MLTPEISSSPERVLQNPAICPLQSFDKLPIVLIIAKLSTTMAVKPIEVAIIGGGITGLTLALGLQKRNINFHIYERAQSLREIGAGIGFTPNAERAMQALDPRIHHAFKSVASRNASDWFQWVDGFSGINGDKDTVEEDLLFNMYLGERGFEGCHRAHFLKELVDRLPDNCVTYGAHLETIIDQGDNGAIQLKFHNGTTAETDLGKQDPCILE